MIIIPTYKECENLKELLPKILDETTHDVLIVDDSSNDGTKELIKKYDRVHLLERKKRGFGSAVLDGLKEGIKRKEAFLLTMDADLSHDPKDISRLLKACKGVDVVIGSRYVKGGAINNWALHRRLLSKAANTYARTVLGLKQKDVTGGFRVYRTSAIKKIINKKFSEGYTFQEEILYRLQGRVKEIPITFIERREGKSKLPSSEIFTGAYRLLKLR